MRKPCAVLLLKLRAYCVKELVRQGEPSLLSLGCGLAVIAERLELHPGTAETGVPALGSWHCDAGVWRLRVQELVVHEELQDVPGNIRRIQNAVDPHASVRIPEPAPCRLQSAIRVENVADRGDSVRKVPRLGDDCIPDLPRR